MGAAAKRPKLKTGQLASGQEYYYLRKPIRPSVRPATERPAEKRKTKGNAELHLTKVVPARSDAKTVRARKGKD